MPTISIIIPAYNAERTILATIASVQQQTFSDWEIIAINDGSTDSTLELLESVKDRRLKIFSYENAGSSVSRNHGIPHATGEFIAFLDADDLWTADKLADQLAALQANPQAGVAYSWTYFMDEQGKSSIPGNRTFFEGNVLANLLVNNFLCSGSNLLIRSQVIKSVGNFDPDLARCVDWDYYLRLAAECDFVLVPKHQIFYRQGAGSLTSNVKIMEASGLLVIEKVFKTVPKELQHLKSQSQAWIFQYCTQKYLQHNCSIKAVNQAGRSLWKAIRLYPPILQQTYTQGLIRGFVKKSILMRLRLNQT